MLEVQILVLVSRPQIIVSLLDTICLHPGPEFDSPDHIALKTGEITDFLLSLERKGLP